MCDNFLKLVSWETRWRENKHWPSENESAHFSLSSFVGVDVMLAVLDEEAVLEELCRTSSTTRINKTKRFIIGTVPKGWNILHIWSSIFIFSKWSNFLEQLNKTKDSL